MNFLNEAKKYQQEAVTRLQELLRIPSVLDEATATNEAPFGKGINDALNYMLTLAQSDGFKTLNDAGYAGHIEYGGSETDPIIGVLCHLDVVPVGTGWVHPPFGAVIEGNNIYARGAMDDKGPTLAAYFALKILKDLGLPLKKRIRIILGTDEETAWRGISHYFKTHEMPEIGFAPDADFPLIYAEKGILRLELTRNFVDDELIELRGGERFNIVIEDAKAKTRSDFRDAFYEYLEAHNLKGEAKQVKDKNETFYTYQIEGVAAHAMEPEKGVNAGTHMASFLSSVITNPVLNFVDDFLHQEIHLEKLGLSHSHPEMGKLTCNVGIIDIDERSGKACLDIRYPIGFDFDQAKGILEKQLKNYNLNLKVVENKKPHYQALDSELVTTLLEAYQKYSGDTVNKPKSIGGGTYARALKQGVAFGMEMPGAKVQAHQRDEMLNIDTFVMAIAIYAEAIYKLGS